MAFGGGGYEETFSRNRFGSDRQRQDDVAVGIFDSAARSRNDANQIEAAERTARHAAKRRGGGGGLGGALASIALPIAGSFLGPIGTAAGGAIGKSLFGIAPKA